eukprot:COSAG01_NODE_1968_length_8769_cov_5.768166_9_plen_135_part_00
MPQARRPNARAGATHGGGGAASSEPPPSLSEAAAVDPGGPTPGPSDQPKPAASARQKGRQHGGDSGSVFGGNRFTSVGEVLAAVPVASAALGAVAGLPASRFVASHFTVMSADAQVLSAVCVCGCLLLAAGAAD